MVAVASAPPALAQDPGSSDAPLVPAIELSDEAEPPERVPILERIGPSRRAAREDEEQDTAEAPGRLPDDIAFVVPGDLRTREARGALPAAEPPPPPTFLVSLGAGFTRQLANVAVDYLRLEQSFEARIPELLDLRVGLGVAELISDDLFVFEIGPRVGLGAGFCNERALRCEGVVQVQPGVAAGYLGVAFDLHARLELRLLIERVVELSAHGAFSLIGGTTFVGAGGNVGIAF